MVKTNLLKLSERFLFVLIVFALFGPLVVTLEKEIERFKSRRKSQHQSAPHSGLSGVTVSAPAVGFGWRSIASGDFQKSLASRFNERFAGREALIRNTNELWFRLFHETATPSSTVAVGRNDVLFEKVYLQEYFLQRNEKQSLAPWVDDLRRLQDFCRQIGMGFVVVVTPSKVAIYPEEVPPAWHRWYDPRPRSYAHLVELFREKGILFVDGPALIAHEKLTNKPSVPLFPKGGVHWSARAVWLVGNAVQARFREQNQPVEPLEILKSTISDEPVREDADLVALMNLQRRWRYPCEKLSIKESPRSESEQLTMASVGGSFTSQLLGQLSASRQFSEIGFYFYYQLSKSCVVDGRESAVRSPGLPIDFGSEIFAADCLLLEINEAAALSPEHHLSAFLTDALAQHPDPSVAQPPFRSERYFHCRWNTELTFRAKDPRRLPMCATSGFANTEREATWTNGAKAIIRFSVPNAEKNIAVQARVGATSNIGLGQKQRATIFANDHPVGEWEFYAGQREGSRAFVIPREVVGEGGKVVLAFHIERPTRPKDVWSGRYRRQRTWSALLEYPTLAD